MKPRKVAILGSGSEALTLAMALMQAKFHTILVEPHSHAAERARFFLGQLSGAKRPKHPLLTIAPDYRSIDTAEIVFSAPVGGPVQLLKAALTKEKDASPTLSAQGVGFHLFAPSNRRRLVEITAPFSQVAFDLARDMGRIPVLAPADRRSVGTRLQNRLYGAAENLLLQGAIPHEIDEALVAFGLDMGLFEAQDLIGVEVANRGHGTRQSVISDRMVQEGRLGKMAGVGWYRYPGGGGAVIDPLIEDLIREEARFASVEMREISGDLAVNCLLKALMGEQKAMLADGTALTVTDIETVLVHGLGFPARRMPVRA